MYDLRYYNPRLSGNIYRSTHPCGKPTCRCAVSKRFWHPSYYLEYHERVKGQWIRKREYVPRAKVKALRQRIRRAKVRDRQQKAQRRSFLKEAHLLAKHLKHQPPDRATLVRIKRLTEAPLPEPVNELERVMMIQAWVTLAKALSQSPTV